MVSLKKSPCFENLEIVNSILIYLAIAAKEAHFCDCSRNKGRFCGVEGRSVAKGWHSRAVPHQILLCVSKLCFGQLIFCKHTI